MTGTVTHLSPRTEFTVSLSARRLRLPLTKPYKLAFGPVEAFDTVLVSATCEGVTGFGDATVLTGYTEETIDGAWALTDSILSALSRATVREALTVADAVRTTAPFTATAFRTAVEMALAHPVLHSSRDRRVPLLAIVNRMDEAGIEAEIDGLLAEGYRTLKIKVGFDRASDARRVRMIQRLVAGKGVALTIDANQGYSQEDGVRFAAELDPQDVLFFEQACHKDDWRAAVAVAKAATTPVMLDESIYDIGDVERAASLGCARYVKLKLMKCGGLDSLRQAIERARALGLEPVMGNGVATDIGCWMEACIAAETITTAGEMNGFLKPDRALVSNPLPVVEGAIVVPAGYVPRLDDDALDACTIDRRD